MLSKSSELPKQTALELKAKEPASNEINLFLSYFTHGKFADSELFAKALLDRFPNSGTCWKLLAASIGQQGRLAESLPPMQMAADLLPKDAESQFNLGVIQQGLGLWKEAETAYCKALTINSSYVEAYNNMGLVLQCLGRLPEAIASFRHALALNPEHAEAHNNLGIIYQELGQMTEAAEHYYRALQIKPGYFEAHNNLGGVLQTQGKLKEAESMLRKALNINPDNTNTLSNLGQVLQSQGLLIEAESMLRRAIQIDTQHTAAWNNLGNTLRAQQKFDDAETCFRQALAIHPLDANTHCNLAVLLQEKGRLTEAINCQRNALKIDPKDYRARSNLLFCLNYTSTNATECLEDAQTYGRLIASDVEKPFSCWNCKEKPERLKIGLVSGDMNSHPVGYFLEGVLANLDASNVELIAYPTNPYQDELTERIRSHFSSWKPLYGQSDEAAASMIHADGVHILVDLSGHTAYNRLAVFARKPAPVQTSWLGYFATTGLPMMDYLIADPWTLPESEEKYFTEHIWRLPETRLCFSAPPFDIPVSALPAIKNGYITFGCFNNLTKMSADVVTTWARILKSVPDSRLLLKSKSLNAQAVKSNVIQWFEQHQVGAERIILEGASPRSEYFYAYHQVDIALDPFPFTGGTTSAECLWMGVPILTLAGNRFVSRQGIGLLMNAGLPQWIANNEDDYVFRARNHASDLAVLADLRSRLRAQALNSPIFDAPRFAKHLGNALWGMWDARK